MIRDYDCVTVVKAVYLTPVLTAADTCVSRGNEEGHQAAIAG